MKNTKNCNIPVYLNNAATSFPKSPGIGEEVAAFFKKIPKHPGRAGTTSEDTLSLCRKELAHLLKTEDPSRLVLCKNATEALNIAVLGIGLKGEVVITTAMEHNSVLRPLYLLEKKGVIRLEIVPCDAEGRVIKEQWEKRIDEFSPKLVVLNQASNVTGAVNNIEELLKYAKEKESITLLDASQSIGLFDMDVSRIAADMIAFTGHKYLLGPSGTGGLYIKEGIEVEPVFVGGTGIRSDLKEMPPEMPLRLEPGTPPVPAFAGLLHSLKWQKENPVSLEKMANLTRDLEQGLIKKGTEVIEVAGERTFIVSCRLPGWDLKEVGYVLERSFGIICRTGLHCAPLIHEYIGTAPAGSIRFSISRFTTREEIDYTLDVIGELVNADH
ncbi:MAG: aminotransferase class V-fold PLP-dependent enzyme [Candidatus Aminicenantes bacterium]|nr:aminotransferase class V-fold PLP-dependent enzyme [Candidatus Aminicenantes bacterium]